MNSKSLVNCLTETINILINLQQQQNNDPNIPHIHKSSIIPLSNRTNFQRVLPGCTRWKSSVWKVFADELPVNTDETPMNFWAKVTHLDPYSLIESLSVFSGGSRGRNPVWKASRWTPLKMPMKFGVLRAAATYTSCWAVGLLTTSFAVEWFSSVFIGGLVWKGGGKIHWCLKSGILPVDSSGVQRVPTGKVGLKGV